MYIASKSIAPGAEEKKLVERASTIIAEAIKKVDDFKNGLWKSYREQVNATKMDPFGK
jgi:hypothetical protein